MVSSLSAGSSKKPADVDNDTTKGCGNAPPESGFSNSPVLATGSTRPKFTPAGIAVLETTRPAVPEVLSGSDASNSAPSSSS